MDAVGYALASGIEPYRWKTLITIPYPSAFSRMAIVGDHLYVLSSDRLQVYDTVMETWTQATPMPTDRQRSLFGVIAVDGKIYVVGGRGGVNTGTSGDKAYVDVYDTATGVWDQLSDLTAYPLSGVARVGCVHIDGKIYALGGVQGIYLSNFVGVYDIATDTWTNVPGGSSNTTYATRGVSRYAAKGSIIYRLGEWIEKWDTTLGSTPFWQYVSTSVLPRLDAAIATDGDLFYSICGRGSVAVDTFNPLINQQKILQNPQAPKSEVDAVYYNGIIYVVSANAAKIDSYYTADQPERGTLLAWLATR